jgi:hypothetical protein
LGFSLENPSCRLQYSFISDELAAPATGPNTCIACSVLFLSAACRFCATSPPIFQLSTFNFSTGGGGGNTYANLQNKKRSKKTISCRDTLYQNRYEFQQHVTVRKRLQQKVRRTSIQQFDTRIYNKKLCCILICRIVRPSEIAAVISLLLDIETDF